MVIQTHNIVQLPYRQTKQNKQTGAIKGAKDKWLNKCGKLVAGKQNREQSREQGTYGNLTYGKQTYGNLTYGKQSRAQAMAVGSKRAGHSSRQQESSPHPPLPTPQPPARSSAAQTSCRPRTGRPPRPPRPPPGPTVAGGPGSRTGHLAPAGQAWQHD